MSGHEPTRLPRRRLNESDRLISEEPRLAGAAAPGPAHGEEPYGGTVQHDSDTLARINALNEERRRLLNTPAFGLAATERAERLRQIQDELDGLWLERRLELSRHSGESPEWLEANEESN